MTCNAGLVEGIMMNTRSETFIKHKEDFDDVINNIRRSTSIVVHIATAVVCAGVLVVSSFI